jgi:hypothetical protein
MITEKEYESLLNEAKTMFASGHDNTYIDLQFAERGIDDDTIQKIIKEINSLKKHHKKRNGQKLIIYGLSFLAVAFIFTLLSYNPESPTKYVLWGLAISGVGTLIKGIADIIGL